MADDVPPDEVERPETQVVVGELAQIPFEINLVFRPTAPEEQTDETRRQAEMRRRTQLEAVIAEEMETTRTELQSELQFQADVTFGATVEVEIRWISPKQSIELFVVLSTAYMIIKNFNEIMGTLRTFVENARTVIRMTMEPIRRAHDLYEISVHPRMRPGPAVQRLPVAEPAVGSAAGVSELLRGRSMEQLVPILVGLLIVSQITLLVVVTILALGK